VEKRFKAGGINHVDLLLAEIAFQQTYIARIMAQSQRFADSAALFQSLGGGWWNHEEEQDEDA
jgi:outer membrane protein TolC